MPRRSAGAIPVAPKALGYQMLQYPSSSGSNRQSDTAFGLLQNRLNQNNNNLDNLQGLYDAQEPPATFQDAPNDFTPELVGRYKDQARQQIAPNYDLAQMGRPSTLPTALTNRIGATAQPGMHNQHTRGLASDILQQMQRGQFTNADFNVDQAKADYGLQQNQAQLNVDRARLAQNQGRGNLALGFLGEQNRTDNALLGHLARLIQV